MRDLLPRSEVQAEGTSFWIMPTDADQDRNLNWLGAEGHQVSKANCYLAPFYRNKLGADGSVEDPELLARIEAQKPWYIFVNVGSGVQEQLGWYLRKNLTYRLAILCTGAAIFVSHWRPGGYPPLGRPFIFGMAAQSPSRSQTVRAPVSGGLETDSSDVQIRRSAAGSEFQLRTTRIGRDRTECNRWFPHPPEAKKIQARFCTSLFLCLDAAMRQLPARISSVVVLVLAALGVISALFCGPDAASPHLRISARSHLSGLPPGWGIDALLSIYGKDGPMAAWLKALDRGRLSYLRERNPDSANPEGWKKGQIAAYRQLTQAGYHILAFSETPGVKPEHPWDQLPEDLLAVYWASRRLSGQLTEFVPIWELPNEPDTMYGRDLPDRVVAYCKAAYLGLKDGMDAGHSEIRENRLTLHPPVRPELSNHPGRGVLMSALGHFPGPWLERAAENGLYDYTDGLNVHFYGHARDFQGALRAQKSFAAQWVRDRELPVWVTECGIDSVTHTNLGEDYGREIQRRFILETAQVALEEKVAAFMPFVLTWPVEEWFALAHSPEAPYPAWTAYAEFTRTHTLPPQLVLASPKNPSRIVIQWRPDYETCIPQKVSGSYWFLGSGLAPMPMKARVMVYNLSPAPVDGILKAEFSVNLKVEEEGLGRKLKIPPFGRVEASMTLAPARPGYFRSDIRFRFESEEATAAPSVALTAVETRPSPEILPYRTEIPAIRPKERDFEWIWSPESLESTHLCGLWLGVNGVAPNGKEMPATGALMRASRFLVEKETVDPRQPPMAITRVNGLPGTMDSFLRMRLPRGASTGDRVRVDLVDDAGQRFAVAENFGFNRFRTDPKEVLFAYRDFQIYAWGRCTERPIFRPEAIREIQLRFYPARYPARFVLSMDVLSSKPLREN